MNHSISVVISTKAVTGLSPASTIIEDSRFEITNPEMSDEQILTLKWMITDQLKPVELIPEEPVVPEEIITETPS